jgi:hypothetical protein
MPEELPSDHDSNPIGGDPGTASEDTGVPPSAPDRGDNPGNIVGAGAAGGGASAGGTPEPAEPPLLGEGEMGSGPDAGADAGPPRIEATSAGDENVE